MSECQEYSSVEYISVSKHAKMEMHKKVWSILGTTIITRLCGSFSLPKVGNPDHFFAEVRV